MKSEPTFQKASLINFLVRVNQCQKHSFFNQSTHNMTTDCSLIYCFLHRKIQIQSMLRANIVLNAKTETKQFLYTTCSKLVFFWVKRRKSMNNLLPYCGLTHARMNPSEKDLTVPQIEPDQNIC